MKKLFVPFLQQAAHMSLDLFLARRLIRANRRLL